MAYITVDENNRVMASCEEKGVIVDEIEVETPPEGNLGDYLYLDGEFVYTPRTAEPTQLDMVEAQAIYTAMLTDTLLGV